MNSTNNPKKINPDVVGFWIYGRFFPFSTATNGFVNSTIHGKEYSFCIEEIDFFTDCDNNSVELFI